MPSLAELHAVGLYDKRLTRDDSDRSTAPHRLTTSVCSDALLEVLRRLP